MESTSGLGALSPSSCIPRAYHSGSMIEVCRRNAYKDKEEEEEEGRQRVEGREAREHGQSFIPSQVLVLLSPECLLTLRGIHREPRREQNILQNQNIKWSKPGDLSAIEVDTK